MPDKPATAAGYGPDFLERARRTCLHVATVIGDMQIAIFAYLWIRGLEREVPKSLSGTPRVC